MLRRFFAGACENRADIAKFGWPEEAIRITLRLLDAFQLPEFRLLTNLTGFRRVRIFPVAIRIPLFAVIDDALKVLNIPLVFPLSALLALHFQFLNFPLSASFVFESHNHAVDIGIGLSRRAVDLRRIFPP